MTSRQHAAFSLVELTLALGVASVCLLSIVGLLPVAQDSHRTASEQTVGNDLASEVISDLRATQKTNPGTAQSSPRYSLTIGAAGAAVSTQTLFFREGAEVIGPPDTAAASASPAPRYRATIFLSAPPSGSRAATTGRVLITWPALADPVPANTPSKYSGSFEAFIGLDRN